MARKFVRSFSSLVVFAAFSSFTLTASAQLHSRIVQNVGDTEAVAISAPHPLARAEFDQGRVEGSMRIRHAAIDFSLSPTQQAALDKLLADQQNPASSNYRQWLTPEQYAARFGMSDADLAKVAAWLKSQGLTVEGPSRARTRLFFSGSAAQVEEAFRTELHRYLVDGQVSYANAIELSVPGALSSVVQSFRGLDSFRPKPRTVVAKPEFTSHVSGNHFIAPADFATIYNLKPLYDAGLDGTGVKIAVAGQTQILAADIDAFRSAAGLSATNLQMVTVDGTGFSTGDEVEADLDVEWSGGVAKNATILYVYTGSNSSQNVFDALAFAIDNNLAPVISISYGNCEASLTGFLTTLRTEVQQANSQGQTITAASGDAGAADCDTGASATHGLAVDAPASVPEVTGMGGSEFNGDVAATVSGTAPNTDASTTTFWQGTSGATDTISSALSYIPEMGWNDTTVSIANGGGLSAGGGGVSTAFTKPSWQTALTPADGHRDVPDLALSSSPNHDGSLICSQAFFAPATTPTSCSSGFRASDGSLAAVGGTSVAAPAFAGIVAILNQATQSSTKTPPGLGNINPTLYTLAVSTPTAFHDISTGNNIVPCTANSTGCPTSHMIGYSAAAGYDQVTGLGSIDANLLATSWPGFVSTADFSVGGTPIVVTAAGQSSTSTITVSPTNGFTGTVTLGCSNLPAGVNCAFAPPSVASGTSTLTVTTTSATPTTATTITVTGTSGSTTHSVSVGLTFAAADFTVTATALTPATVAAGAAATSTITVAPTPGFTGTVNFSCSITGGGSPAPTCTFAPSSVTNGGTATLTVNTTAAHVASGGASGRSSTGFGWLTAGGTLFVGIFLVGVPARQRRRWAGLGLMLLVCFAAGFGCGGGSGSSNTTPSGGTKAGTYAVTVTAKSTAPTLSHTAALTVTVQ